ncbi:S8 family peptidase [Cohnella suwonensis]|uniref:S8 family peptidase n=1 Tax=Cohnella suwonensis TaxID=696072 RepID=A0ABW0LST4_9BACL
MNALAKTIGQSVKPRPSARTERKNIVFHRDADYRRCLKQLAAAGIVPVKKVDAFRLICCHADKSSDWKALNAHPRVAFAERDRKAKAHDVVIPSRIPWNVKRVKAPPQWNTSGFGAGAKIGILDTGIARSPDLTIAGGVNTIGGKSFADDNGHGTHVAGIAAATGRQRIYGVAPKAKLFAVKVLDASGSGFISDIVEGIDWCLSRGIRIMNMSFGLTGDSAILKAAIVKARRRGAVIVASPGNSGTALRRIDAPARYPQTIAVAATTRANRVAFFSSRGKGIDIAAPGVNILSTWLGGTYRRESGTSMSAPHVTGAAALLRAIRPKLTATEVARRIKKAALPIPGGANAVGSGLLQAAPAAAGLKRLKRTP